MIFWKYFEYQTSCIKTTVFTKELIIIPFEIILVVEHLYLNTKIINGSDF